MGSGRFLVVRADMSIRTDVVRIGLAAVGEVPKSRRVTIVGRAERKT